jgi:hypothetical protein
MAETSAEPRVVVVAGDVTIDWNLARIPRPPDLSKPGKRGTSVMSPETGGAALLGKLITAIGQDIEKPGDRIDVRTVGEPKGARPGGGAHNHSYAIWSLHEREPGEKGNAWRISQPLGIEDVAPGTTPEHTRVMHDPPTADVVVLDAGLGGNQPKEDWPQAIMSADARPHVVLKMARPVGDGALWDHLVAHHADRLVAVVRANDLRITEAEISRGLSWEQSAQDLLRELTYNPEVKRLTRCAHLIVSFGTSGAMLLSRSEQGPPQATLFFDPPVMEEEWAERYPGGMLGYTTCLTAAVGREIIRSGDDARIGEAIKRGLEAMRRLHLDGFEVDDVALPRVRFPAERIAQSMTREEEQQAAEEKRSKFAEVRVPRAAAKNDPQTDRWTILETVFTEGLEQVARRIVLEGPDQIVSEVPVAEFGKLQTIDRTEIEGYRSVRSLIAQYADEDRPDRPLSIAVFGRPGSGKSFGIKQIARTLLPDRIKDMTFNLSQFDDPHQLLEAFHQVRDVTLNGKLPLVFWDEFDAMLGPDKLGWLKHFLAPMQDGEFQQGQVTHHIGAAIFVFAGGTKQTMLKFSEQFEGEKGKALAHTKGRDFVSRLKGYVDVAGPNPNGSIKDDPHYIIRRAILLRSMLKGKEGLMIEVDGRKKLQIDGGVLKAFLRVKDYRHGARSMESAIAMSLLKGKSRFERSALPSADQLGIHVTPDFLELVRSLIIEGRMLRELAEAVHVAYCEMMLEDGYTWAEPGDEYLERHDALRRFVGHARDPQKTAPNLVAYENLADAEKEQNEDFARDIPNKAEGIGYEIVPARGDETGDAFPSDVIELLAEQEHDRWMKLKLQRGCSWGKERDDKHKLVPAMLPWRELTNEERIERYGEEGDSRVGTAILPESEKKKDRSLIQAVANILAENGYRIAPRA